MSPGNPPKFVAVIDEVREVSLIGLSDAACWARWLRSIDLQTASKNGKVQILLTAIQARYMGIPFRELSLAVSVRHPDEAAYQNCLYLAHAFHSSRFLAFVERTYFRTPYYPADIEVDTQLPVFFAAGPRDGRLVAANMNCRAGVAREPVRSGHESWEGPIFLPRLGTRDPVKRRWFAARLAGETLVYPFLPGLDEFAVRPTAEYPVLQLLAESNFAGQEWIVRESALHARSKTYGEAHVVRTTRVEAPALETPG